MRALVLDHRDSFVFNLVDELERAGLDVDVLRTSTPLEPLVAHLRRRARPAPRRVAPERPVLCDPSHGTGDRERVRPLARAALAVGAHGLIVEAHTDPDRATSDAD